MKQGWKIKKLGEVCSVAAGQSAPQGDANYCTNGTPFIKAGNLESLINGLPESDIQNVSDDVAKQHRLKLYKAGSVVFAKSGMSCMKGYVYSLKTDCYVVSHLAILTPHGISTPFLKYILEYHRPNTLVKDSAYPSISLEDIKSFGIPVPSNEEQDKIVAELNSLTKIIEKKKRQLKLYDSLAQSFFYEMFGNPVINEKYWEVDSLKNLTTKIGSGATPKGGNESYKNEGVSLIRSLNVYNNHFNYKDLAYIDDAQANALKNVTIEHGDVLLNITGASVARCCIVPIEVLPARVNQHVAIMRCKPILNNTFFSYLLTSSAYQSLLYMLSKSNGATREALTKGQLEKLKIILPPLELQQIFAKKIEAIEKQKELIKKSIKEVENLFNSRMDYYFN